MANPEKDIAEAILRAEGLSAAKLGLRFDKVVVRVLGDLRALAEQVIPEPFGVAFTLTAPIRLPAKTVEALRPRLEALAAPGRPTADDGLSLHGNQVRLRLATRAAGRPKLIGFVHNPDQDAGRLLDLAERGLGRA